ncbi:MAG: NERD domain-containing protein [Ruminococcus sp.]|nr:NERD domain-containing protein [Ruminococcus sp.]
MAIIYPKIREKISASYAEQKVYEALCGLSNDFIVFHSVNWVKKNFSRSFTWYENDFLLLNRKYGLLVLEVKGGIISCVDGLIHQENTATHRVSILNEGNDRKRQMR